MTTDLQSLDGLMDWGSFPDPFDDMAEMPEMPAPAQVEYPAVAEAIESTGASVEVPAVPVAAPLHPNFTPAPAVKVNPVDLQLPESEEEEDRDDDLLYFDLETIPDFSREHLFGLDPVKELAETPTDQMLSPAEWVSQGIEACRESLANKMPTASWVDDAKIAESQQKKPRKGIFELLESVNSRREEIAEGPRNRIKLMSVTPEYCRILSVAYAIGNGPVETIFAETDDLEAGLLRMFWQKTEGRRLVVFNGLSFDIPVLLVRSSILGVRTGRTSPVNLSPFGGNRDALDLMRVRFGNQVPSGWGMKKLARVYGIDVPAGDVNGSHVYELFQAKQFEAIKEYNKSDVVVLREFHRRLRGRFCE